MLQIYYIISGLQTENAKNQLKPAILAFKG